MAIGADATNRPRLPDQRLAGLRRVALVEHEIENVDDCINPCGELRCRRHIERQLRIANLPLGADETLGDRSFVGEERPRDLARAETAGGFEAERDARLPRQRRMAAHEDHSQLIVSKLAVIRVGEGLRCGPRQLGDDRIGFGCERSVASHGVDRNVVCHAEEPAGRIAGRAFVRPRLQRPHQGFLHRLLGEREVGGAEKPHQAGRHAARLMAEQVFEQRTGVVEWVHWP